LHVESRVILNVYYIDISNGYTILIVYSKHSIQKYQTTGQIHAVENISILFSQIWKATGIVFY